MVSLAPGKSLFNRLMRTRLINRKGVTVAQDRRPLERLSGIDERASRCRLQALARLICTGFEGNLGPG